MSIAIVSNVGTGGSANVVTSGSINTTGANLIVLMVSYYGISLTVGAADISDSKGNTWSACTLYSSAGGDNVRLFYCYNPTVGSGHTFTVTKTGTYPSIGVLAVSGAASVPLDQQNGSGGGTGTTKQPGSVTPTENNELIVAGLYHSSVASVSIDSGMTISNQVAYNSGVCVGMVMAYKIQTTAAAINPTFTVTTGLAIGANIATFKASAVIARIGASVLRQPLSVRTVRGGR